MIVDHIRNRALYDCLGERFRMALDYCANYVPGRTEKADEEIDGDNVFATVYEKVYEAREFAYEAHARYADIQVVLSGAERFALGWNPMMGAQKPGKDFWYGTADTYTENTLTAGQFVIYMPGELHAPGNPAGAPGAATRKIVVKVKV